MTNEQREETIKKLIEINQNFIQQLHNKTSYTSLYSNLDSFFTTTLDYKNQTFKSQIKRAIKSNNKRITEKPNLRITLDSLLILNICEINGIKYSDLMKECKSTMQDNECRDSDIEKLSKIESKIDMLLDLQKTTKRYSINQRIEKLNLLINYYTNTYKNNSITNDQRIQIFLLHTNQNITPMEYFNYVYLSPLELNNFLFKKYLCEFYPYTHNKKHIALINTLKTNCSFYQDLLTIEYQYAVLDSISHILKSTISKEIREAFKSNSNLGTVVTTTDIKNYAENINEVKTYLNKIYRSLKENKNNINFNQNISIESIETRFSIFLNFNTIYTNSINDYKNFAKQNAYNFNLNYAFFMNNFSVQLIKNCEFTRDSMRLYSESINEWLEKYVQ